MFDNSAGEWREVALDQVCRIAIGGTPSRAVPRYWSDAVEGYPWTSIADLKSSRILETKEYISKDGVENSNVKLVPRGTVVMSFKLTIGRTAIADRDLYTNEAIAAFTPKEGLDRGFLFYWLPYLAESAETDQAIKGVTLNKEKLLAMSGLLPPLDEQRRIAEVLQSVDEAIRSQSAVCDQLDVTFSSLTEACFTVGDNAEGRWPILPLDELCESIQVGIVVRPASYYVESGGIPALRSLNVGENRLDLGNLVYISIEGHHQNNKSSLRAGDVVTRRTGEPGKTAVIPAEFPNGLNCIDIIFSRPKAKVRSEFLAFFMNSDAAKRQVLGLQGGLAQQHLNIGEMKTIKVPVPEIAIQDQEIATLKTTLERLETEKALLRRLSSLKTALAADLLSGRVRVPA